MSFESMMATALDYRQYAQKKCNAHYQMSEAAKSKHTKLGVPVTVATAVVGTAIFATLNSPTQIIWIQIGAGLLSLAAAVLSALQTFFNFSDAAAQHKDAAANYEDIRHLLDWFILSYDQAKDQKNLDEPLKTLREIATKMNDAAKKAPSIPDNVYDAIKVEARVNARVMPYTETSI